MGSNPTQAIALVLLILAFVSIAGAMAGGGLLSAAAAVAFTAGSVFFFRKCKPWEDEQS